MKREEYTVGRFNFSDEDLASDTIDKLRPYRDQLVVQLAGISEREDRIEFFNQFASGVLGIDVPIQRDAKGITDNPHISTLVIAPALGSVLRKIRLPKRATQYEQASSA